MAGWAVGGMPGGKLTVFCDTELGVKPVWSICGCDEARLT